MSRVRRHSYSWESASYYEIEHIGASKRRRQMPRDNPPRIGIKPEPRTKPEPRSYDIHVGWGTAAAWAVVAGQTEGFELPTACNMGHAVYRDVPPGHSAQPKAESAVHSHVALEGR